VRRSDEIEVRIERSVVMERKLELEDGESITKEVYPSPESSFDRGSAV
jgi:hypothetical protein